MRIQTFFSAFLYIIVSVSAVPFVSASSNSPRSSDKYVPAFRWKVTIWPCIDELFQIFVNLQVQ